MTRVRDSVLVNRDRLKFWSVPSSRPKSFKVLGDLQMARLFSKREDKTILKVWTYAYVIPGNDHISLPKSLLSRWFSLIPRWDMLVPWRVPFWTLVFEFLINQKGNHKTQLHMCSYGFMNCGFMSRCRFMSSPMKAWPEIQQNCATCQALCDSQLTPSHTTPFLVHCGASWSQRYLVCKTWQRPWELLWSLLRIHVSKLQNEPLSQPQWKEVVCYCFIDVFFPVLTVSNPDWEIVIPFTHRKSKSSRCLGRMGQW